MFVEVLDRHGDVRSRARINGDGFSIGRAYDNDLILDDPFVAPHHLSIECGADGALQVRDLGSANGMHAVAINRRVDALDVTEDARVRIGHTQLRFRSANFPVPDAMTIGAAQSPMRGAAYFYVTLVLASAMLALEAHLSTFGEVRLAQLIAAVLATLLGASAWIGLWSFASRIATRRANFYAHGAATMAAVAGLVLVNNVSEYVEFSVSALLADGFLLVSIAAIVTALLYRQVRLVSRISARHAVLTVGGVVGVLLGSSWLVQYAVDINYSSRLDYPSALKAPPFRLSKGVTPAAFATEASRLREELDSLRVE